MGAVDVDLLNVLLDGGAADVGIHSIRADASSLFFSRVGLKGVGFEISTNHSESSVPPLWCRLGNPAHKGVSLPAPIALSVVMNTIIMNKNLQRTNVVLPDPPWEWRPMPGPPWERPPMPPRLPPTPPHGEGSRREGLEKGREKRRATGGEASG